jgi:hypothetical protein
MQSPAPDSAQTDICDQLHRLSALMQLLLLVSTANLMTLQVIRGFREQHATAPKAWIERRVKADAVYNGNQWVVKAEVLQALGK